MNDMPQNWQALLQQTDLARRRQIALEAECAVGGPPREGDLFVLEACSEQPVEWAVLTPAPAEAARVQIVAVDASPLLGSADIAARPERRGPVSVRCAWTAWLSAATLQTSRPTGRLSAEAVESARQNVQKLVAGEEVGNAWKRQVDIDPEYRLWQKEVLEPAHAALPCLDHRTLPMAPVAVHRQGPAPSRRLRRFRQPLALAASVLMVLSLGLGREVLRMHREAERHTESHLEQMRELEQTRAAGAAAHQREVNRLRLEHERAMAALEQKLAAESSPRAQPPPAPLVNLPFVVLTSARQRGATREVNLSGPAEYLLVLLQVEDPPPGARYRLQMMLDGPGDEVWSHRGLALTGRSELSVALPRELLATGTYRFILSLREGDGWRAVDEYGLEVR